MRKPFTLRRLLLWVGAVCIFCAVISYGYHALWVASLDAAYASACQGRIFKLDLALRHYHEGHGHLPPAYIAGPDGKPWHSWRVLVLPYLGHESLYSQYRFDEPWNGPHNRMLANKISSAAFQCPGGDDYEKSANTNFVVVTGEGTLFPGSKTEMIADPWNTTDRRILVVEIADSDIHWMEPRDLELDRLSPIVGRSHFGSTHQDGAGVMRADRSFERLPNAISSEQLAHEMTSAAAPEDLVK